MSPSSLFGNTLGMFVVYMVPPLIILFSRFRAAAPPALTDHNIARQLQGTFWAWDILMVSTLWCWIITTRTGFGWASVILLALVIALAFTSAKLGALLGRPSWAWAVNAVLAGLTITGYVTFAICAIVIKRRAVKAARQHADPVLDGIMKGKKHEDRAVKSQLLTRLKAAVEAKTINGGIDEGRVWVTHPATKKEIYADGLALSDLEYLVRDANLS